MKKYSFVVVVFFLVWAHAAELERLKLPRELSTSVLKHLAPSDDCDTSIRCGVLLYDTIRPALPDETYRFSCGRKCTLINNAPAQSLMDFYYLTPNTLQLARISILSGKTIHVQLWSINDGEWYTVQEFIEPDMTQNASRGDFLVGEGGVVYVIAKESKNIHVWQPLPRYYNTTLEGKAQSTHHDLLLNTKKIISLEFLSPTEDEMLVSLSRGRVKLVKNGGRLQKVPNVASSESVSKITTNKKKLTLVRSSDDAKVIVYPEKKRSVIPKLPEEYAATYHSYSNGAIPCMVAGYRTTVPPILSRMDTVDDVWTSNERFLRGGKEDLQYDEVHDLLVWDRVYNFNNGTSLDVFYSGEITTCDESVQQDSWILINEEECQFMVDEELLLEDVPVENCLDIPLGCDGVPGSLLQWDDMGVCGGNRLVSSPSSSPSPSMSTSSSSSNTPPSSTTPTPSTPPPSSSNTPQPSTTPTSQPSTTPTSQPSTTPTEMVSATPTSTTPTEMTSATPSEMVSATPSETVSATPTGMVSATPSEMVSATPTGMVSATPSEMVSATPSETVSATPTGMTSATSEVLPSHSCAPSSLPCETQFNGDYHWCYDCAGVRYGTSYLDICGECNDGSRTLSCIDRFGEVCISSVLDDCGVCGGDNSTCVGQPLPVVTPKTTTEIVLLILLIVLILGMSLFSLLAIIVVFSR